MGRPTELQAESELKMETDLSVDADTEAVPVVVLMLVSK